MNRYQWTVLFAAWLGWGFDVFDGLLFNFVAPNAVPTLLDLPIGSAAAKAATFKWTGILNAILLIGWGAGGILFGHVADRIGRMRTLMLTMLLYAIGTAACALATNMWMLMAFPRGRQPRHRRRMGGGRGDGRRGRARKTARGSGRAALHVRAAGIVSGAVRQLDHRRRSLERESVDVMAVCVPVRPDPRGGRLRRAHLRQGTGALEAGRGINGASTHPRAVHARAPTGDAERLRHGGHRPHHLVDRQRFHPDRFRGARRGARDGAGARSRGDAGAQGGVAEHRNRCLQRRWSAWHVARPSPPPRWMGRRKMFGIYFGLSASR